MYQPENQRQQHQQIINIGTEQRMFVQNVNDNTHFLAPSHQSADVFVDIKRPNK